jgi:AraC-like DNA-binding protein
MPPTPPWITAFAAQVPPGTRHEGRVRRWVLGLCSDGAAEHGPPDGPRFVMGAGEMVTIRPGVDQRWIAHAGRAWEVVSCVFDPRPHWLPWLEFDPVAPGFTRLRLRDGDWRDARRAIHRACQASGSGHHDALDLCAHAVEEVLLICRRARAAAARVDARVGLALDELASRLDRPLPLAELARRCGISTPHLLRLFRRHVGASPAAYHARLRLQRAEQLLRHSDLPVKAVARAVGFADQRYFSSWFRRLQGHTPSTHRSG